MMAKRFSKAGVTVFGCGLILVAFAFPRFHLFVDVGSVRLADYVLSLAALLFLAGGLSRQVSQDSSFWAFLRSSRNAYSLSHLQMAAWWFLVFAALFAAGFCNIWSIGGQATSANDALDITIDPNLLAVLGISGFSLAATPAILSLRSQTDVTDAQVDAAQQRLGADQPITANGNVVIRSDPSQASLADVVRGDEVANTGLVDLGKVQNLILSGVLMLIYVKMTVDLLLHQFPTSPVGALPTFSGNAVQLLALSHAGYLAYKAAPKPADGDDTPATLPPLPSARPVNVAPDPRQGVG
jgi:hypothetical protein